MDILKKKDSIDPLLVGEWRHKNTYYLFENDGATYIGTRNIPYEIKDNGSTLIINKKTRYQRIGNQSTSIQGIWRDNLNGEEIQYREDGRYINLWDDEKWCYCGFYTATHNIFNSYELRMYTTTENNIIRYHSLYFLCTEGSYTIQGDLLRITINDQTTEYTRVVKLTL